MPNALHNIDVFILCGGRGSRLNRAGIDTPKPMQEIRGRPFLDIIIRYLSGFGLRRFILGTGYKAGVIESYYRQNALSGVEIVFSPEDRPLDTGGAVCNARGLIRSSHFFVLNGDSFCKFNPARLFSFHQKKKAMASILLRKAGDTMDFGSVKMGSASRIVSFNEKAHSAQSSLINAGVYIFDKNIFSLFPHKKFFSLEYDFFPKIIPRGIFGYITAVFFIDIGTPQRLQQARQGKGLLAVLAG